MIKAIKKFYSSLFYKNTKIKKIGNHNRILDNDNINKQKLYEKWCKKEKWLLFNEGILLLFSIDPSQKEHIGEELIAKINNLKLHANECAKKNLLSIKNIDKPESEWEVKPIDLYQWATISRIKIPDEFNTLMTFIIQSVKPIQPENLHASSDIKSSDMIDQMDKEAVLGATVSILINFPDICKSSEGKIESILVAEKIIENEKYWFNNKKSKLSKSEISKIIDDFAMVSKSLY